nr:MAG TPA: hypothetical protein [Caudoviricetes sp.]
MCGQQDFLRNNTISSPPAFTRGAIAFIRLL